MTKKMEERLATIPLEEMTMEEGMLMTNAMRKHLKKNYQWPANKKEAVMIRPTLEALKKTLKAKEGEPGSLTFGLPHGKQEGIRRGKEIVNETNQEHAIPSDNRIEGCVSGHVAGSVAPTYCYNDGVVDRSDYLAVVKGLNAQLGISEQLNRKLQNICNEWRGTAIRHQESIEVRNRCIQQKMDEITALETKLDNWINMADEASKRLKKHSRSASIYKRKYYAAIGRKVKR